MILEVSVSLLSPSLWDIQIGRNKVEGVPGHLSADSITIKFLFLMAQFTLYTVVDEED